MQEHRRPLKSEIASSERRILRRQQADDCSGRASIDHSKIREPTRQQSSIAQVVVRPTATIVKKQDKNNGII